MAMKTLPDNGRFFPSGGTRHMDRDYRHGVGSLVKGEDECLNLLQTIYFGRKQQHAD